MTLGGSLRSYGREILAATQRDVAYAALACALVLVLMYVHLRSAALALLGLLQILCALPLAFAMYRLVLGIPYNGELNLLACVVTLGVGADDLFVFADKWKLHSAAPIKLTPTRRLAR